MNSAIEILEWDSNFFKLKVCKVTGTINGDDDLTELLIELKALNVDLAYFSSSHPLPNNTSPVYNIELVDIKTTYLKKADSKSLFDSSITIYKASYPNDKLFELAIESGIYSRFNTDKKIGTENYQELYRRWMVDSVNKKLAKEVLVSMEDNIITGFVTLGEKNDRADIGIIAVDRNYRGKGIGKALMSSAESWFTGNHYEYVQVVTQKQNLPACRLYESCGYMVDKAEYFYHFWLTYSP